MDSKLKILHIEDNHFDAELIRENILSRWKDCEIKIISDRESLRKEVENLNYDLVLCDYRIPGFNTGFEVLEIIREKNKEIPLLFISGTIGEELAVELLKKGATDYILKDKLVKLIPAIERALAEYKTLKDKLAAQKALEASEKRYKDLFLNSPVGIYRSTPDGKIILANPSFLKILKYSSFEELQRKNQEKGDFLQKKDRKRYNELMEKNNEVIGFESVWRDSKGTAVFILENSRAVRDEDGNLLYYEGTIEDESEKRIAYEKLKESEAQLSLAQETAKMGNWEIDLLWETFSCSKGLLKIFGLNPEQTDYNKNILFNYVHDEDKEFVIKKINEEIRKNTNGFSFQFRIVRPDGEVRILNCILSTELFSGVVRKVTGTVQDITEQKKIEEELIEAKRRAEESDRIKTEFLSQISHEIRTPLNTLFNLSHLINLETKKEEFEELQGLFDNIDFNGRRLLRTIELMLNVATINNQTYSPDIKKINLQDFIDNIFKAYNKEIKSKEIKTNILYERDDNSLKSDEYLLHHILDNVINNAVKFTNRGEVTVKISEADGHCYFEIKDTGIGIDKKYQPNLFKPFMQESAGYSRKYEGNGLGLTLTKKFTEILNGSIEIISEKGEGTTCIIKLPLVK